VKSLSIVSEGRVAKRWLRESIKSIKNMRKQQQKIKIIFFTQVSKYNKWKKVILVPVCESLVFTPPPSQRNFN
jgi:hypothetical protein